MDKGIIIGVEHELAVRSNLPFVLFRHSTSVSQMGVPVKSMLMSFEIVSFIPPAH